MEQKFGRIPALLLTILLSAAAYGLRLHQLTTAFDASNNYIAGTGKGFFTWFCVVVVVLFVVYSYCLRPRKKYASISSRELPLVIVTVAASLLMVLGSVATLISPEQQSDALVAVGGFATALCWIATAFARYRGQKATVLLFLVPAVFYVIKLIPDFRLWSRDPVLLDYCYDLLAMISIMCGVFHLGGYCFDQGRRRINTFFCLCGVFFSAAAMVGARPRDLMMYGAAVLWLLVNLWLLLRPGKKRADKETA